MLAVQTCVAQPCLGATQFNLYISKYLYKAKVEIDLVLVKRL